MRRKYYHVHSLLITDKSYQLVQTKESNYGILEERTNSLVMIQIIRIGSVVLDIHQSWRTRKQEIVHTSVQWVGMVESRYGIPISKSDVVSNIMMRISTVYLFHQMESIWLLLEEERMLRFGMSLLWENSLESLIMILKCHSWLSILSSNGLLHPLKRESKYGIWWVMLKHHLLLLRLKRK